MYYKFNIYVILPIVVCYILTWLYAYFISGNEGNVSNYAKDSEGSPEAAKRLLELGADVHCKDSSGNSVLMYAVLSGSLEKLKVLMEALIDPCNII